MKKIIPLLMIFMLVAGALPVQASRGYPASTGALQPAGFQIDLNTDNGVVDSAAWNSIPVLVEDPAGDSDGFDHDLINAWLAEDTQNPTEYFLFRIQEAPKYGHQAWFSLDCDGNLDTPPDRVAPDAAGFQNAGDRQIFVDGSASVDQITVYGFQPSRIITQTPIKSSEIEFIGVEGESGGNRDYEFRVAKSKLGDCATKTFRVMVSTVDDDSAIVDYTPVGVKLEKFMEVTQGIQNLNNDLPLLEGRQTFVRVFFNVNYRTMKLEDIRLKVLRDGQPVAGTPLSPDNAGGYVPKEKGIDRYHDWGGPYFIIPSSELHGSLDLRFEQDYTDLVDNTQKQIVLDRSISFQPAQPINLRVVSLHMHVASDPHQPELVVPTSAFGPSLLGMYRHLPTPLIIARNAPTVLLPSGHGTLHANEWQMNTELGQALVLDDLGRLRDQERLANNLSHLYYLGLVHPEVDTIRPGGFSVAGLATLHSGLFWSKNNVVDAPSWFRESSYTAAHELMHAAGQQHISCTGSEGDPDPTYPWPFPKCKLADLDANGYAGMDVYYRYLGFDFSTVLKPKVSTNADTEIDLEVAYPLMGYKFFQWVSPWEYCQMMGILAGVPCSVTFKADGALLARLQLHEKAPLEAQAGPYLSLRGVVDITGAVAEVRSIIEMTDLPANYVEPAASDYVVELRDADGNLLDSRKLEATGGEGDTVAFPFWAILPKPAGLAKVQVRQGTTLLGEQIASDHAPSVTLTSPNSGSLASGQVVTWDAADQDGDTLSYDLLYSRDGGVSWTALAINWPETSFTLGDLSGLGGAQNAILRVDAYDGFHTASDASDGALTLADQAPTVMLGLQADTVVHLQPGSTLLALAIASDPEDGPLSGASITWSSSLDGAIGIGDQLYATGLTPGVHTVTVTATDSQGHTAQATFQAFVGYRLFVPSLYK